MSFWPLPRVFLTCLSVAAQQLHVALSLVPETFRTAERVILHDTSNASRSGL